MKPLFLVTDHVPEEFFLRLEALGFEAIHHPALRNEELAPLLPTLTGIVTWSGLYLGEREFHDAPILKYVLRPGSGLDNVELPAARRRGILVVNSPEANAPAVAEHALGCLLALRRNIHKAANEAKAFQWTRHPNTGEALQEAVVGIIGYGNAGSAFSRLLRPFGCRILAYDPFVAVADTWAEQVVLPRLMEYADVVSLHVPLTPQTRYLVDADFIGGMERPFYLINTSRGANVDLEALAAGLESGKVRGAALDVLPNERPDTFSPAERALHERLHATGRAMVTPHIAGWTHTARRQIFMKVLEKFEQHCRLSNS